MKKPIPKSQFGDKEMGHEQHALPSDFTLIVSLGHLQVEYIMLTFHELDSERIVAT